MKIKMNEMLTEWFISTYFGFIPPSDIVDPIISKEVSYYRQGQLINVLSEFPIRSSSNILCKRQEFFEPICWDNIQEHLGLKSQAFKSFKDDMVKLNRIKEVNNNIYVNPSFIISFEMDYIRDELRNMFPEDAEDINTINEYLKGNYGRRK